MAGAIRMKTGAEKIGPNSRISDQIDFCALRLGVGGTASHIHSETQAAAIASTQKAPRQPMAGSTACIGTVAKSPPMPPTKTPAPVNAATRSRGNHSVCPLINPISPEAMPMPVTNRPQPSMKGPAAAALRAKPRQARAAEAHCTRRGP